MEIKVFQRFYEQNKGYIGFAKADTKLKFIKGFKGFTRRPAIY